MLTEEDDLLSSVVTVALNTQHRKFSFILTR